MTKKKSIISESSDFYEVHEQSLKKTSKSILDVRDRIGHIKDLLVICQEALIVSSLNEIKRVVGDVLYFQVQEQLRIADEELKTI